MISKDEDAQDNYEEIREEGRLLESLDHPNIVKFNKVVETGTNIFLSMEILEGGLLSNVIKERKENG